MAWANFVQMGIDNFVGGMNMFMSKKEEARAARRNAKAAQDQAAAQAAQESKQADIAMIQAANAQRQGEIEANKRSRILAQDIGSTYANWAANGLMVDGAKHDTLYDVLKTSRDEANFDISTTLENSHMSAWTYAENAKAHRQSAAAAIATGDAMAKEYKRQAKAAKKDSAYGFEQAITGVPASILKSAGVSTNLRTGVWKFGGPYGWSSFLNR